MDRHKLKTFDLQGIAHSTSAVTVKLKFKAEDKEQSELELSGSFEASWESRTREGRPNGASLLWRAEHR